MHVNCTDALSGVPSFFTWHFLHSEVDRIALFSWHNIYTDSTYAEIYLFKTGPSYINSSKHLSALPCDPVQRILKNVIYTSAVQPLECIRNYSGVHHRMLRDIYAHNFNLS